MRNVPEGIRLLPGIWFFGLAATGPPKGCSRYPHCEDGDRHRVRADVGGENLGGEDQLDRAEGEREERDEGAHQDDQKAAGPAIEAEADAREAEDRADGADLKQQAASQLNAPLSNVNARDPVQDSLVNESLDSDFAVYRKSRRKVIPLLRPER
jgi:hypothetical protein